MRKFHTVSGIWGGANPLAKITKNQAFVKNYTPPQQIGKCRESFGNHFFQTVGIRVFSSKRFPTTYQNHGSPPSPPRRGGRAMGLRVSFWVWGVPAGQAGGGRVYNCVKNANLPRLEDPPEGLRRNDFILTCFSAFLSLVGR